MYNKMKEIEIQAKTIEEAVNKGLKELELQREDVEVEIIEEGSRGILGFMSKSAKVRIREKWNSLKTADKFIRELIQKIGVETQISIKEELEGIKIHIEGKNLGVLIGKRGNTLDAIQYLTNLAVNRQNDKHKRIIVEIEDYRKKRQESLERFALNMAKKAKQTKKDVILEPMIPNERRIVHTVLQGEFGISTRSIGEEPYRRVVISPK
jgi:spoIIIJ-associated protein